MVNPCCLEKSVANNGGRMVLSLPKRWINAQDIKKEAKVGLIFFNLEDAEQKQMYLDIRKNKLW